MNKKYLFPALALLFVLGIFLLHRSGALAVFSGTEAIHFVAGFGVWAPIVYIVAYALASLAFVPGTPLTLAGGALFGVWYGTAYTVVGATIGATLAFVLSRTIRHFTFTTDKRMSGGAVAQKLQVYDEKIATHGFITVLFLRFVPLFPFNGLNFALGFTKVSYRDYVLGTFLGIIPGTFAFVYAGSSLATLNPYKIGSAVVLVGLLSLIGRYVLKRYDTKYQQLPPL